MGTFKLVNDKAAFKNLAVPQGVTRVDRGTLVFPLAGSYIPLPCFRQSSGTMGDPANALDSPLHVNLLRCPATLTSCLPLSSGSGHLLGWQDHLVEVGSSLEDIEAVPRGRDLLYDEEVKQVAAKT